MDPTIPAAYQSASQQSPAIKRSRPRTIICGHAITSFPIPDRVNLPASADSVRENKLPPCLTREAAGSCAPITQDISLLVLPQLVELWHCAA